MSCYVVHVPVSWLYMFLCHIESTPVWMVCTSSGRPPRVHANVHCCMQVPEVDECVQAIVNIVPLQLLSYHLTLLRGHNVDQPRNLAKAVTVSEEG